MVESLVDYLKKQSQIFCQCPICREIFRLSESRITWGKIAKKDLLDKIREQKAGFDESLLKLQGEYEEQFTAQRADAVKRSRSSSLGKMLEHISPYFPSFKHNPRDARFIGDPIDYVLFKGVYEDRTVDEIILAEIKSGKSRLNTTERSVKKAIENGKVRFEEIRVE